MPLADYIDGLYVEDGYFEGQFIADVPGDEEQPPDAPTTVWRTETTATPQLWDVATTTLNR